MRVRTDIATQPKDSRVDYFNGMIQAIDADIAKGEIQYKAIRKEIVIMRREAKQEAKRTQYSKEGKA